MSNIEHRISKKEVDPRFRGDDKNGDDKRGGDNKIW